MARNDGVDRTFARNRDLRLDKKATPQSAYEHNERTKESYSNADIVPERTPLNVHYKTPVGTYHVTRFFAIRQCSSQDCCILCTNKSESQNLIASEYKLTLNPFHVTI